MTNLSARLAVAVVLAGFWGSRTAHAQVAPLTYWIAGWPVGFSGSSGEGFTTYGSFPSFEASEAGGFSYTRYNFPSGWLVGSERSGIGLGMGGLAGGAFTSFGSLYSEGVELGYSFKSAGGLPITVYAGVDTLKYDAGIGGALLAPFDTQSGTLPGYTRAHAGVEIKPASNVSLSLGIGSTQQSGLVDSDINSPLPPGATPFAPFAFGGRR